MAQTTNLSEAAIDPRIEAYRKEYTRWLNVLQNYHVERFTKNYQQYTAYTSTAGTHTKISDPLAPELVERVVQKLFARDPNFIVMARGKDLPKEVTDVMQSVASYFWTNPEKVASSGSLRQKLKVGGREFCIIGNICVETYYNAESESPDFRVWPVEDVIFNPSMSLKASNKYYFRQYISAEYLQEMVEEKDDEGNVVSGLFDKEAVDRVLAQYDNVSGSMKSDPTPNQVMRSGNSALTPHVEDILMVSCWDPDTLEVCRIVDWKEIVQETTDPLGIETFPYDFAMDIEVPKQPYGFSLLDFISGVTQAKDLFINQIVDYGSRALNPPLFVDPSSPAVNKMTLRNAFRIGGIVYADPKSAQHMQYPALPPEGFELLAYLQQRGESVTGVSPYVGGVPNAQSDKTKGTKGGIQALIDQAGSPIQDRQQNIEESIIEPILNKFFKLAAALIGTNEEKYVFLTGQSTKWVQLTKGLLSGNITLKDLVTCGLIKNDPVPDPTTGQPMQDPRTGQPIISHITGFVLGSEADQLALLLKSQGKNPNKEVLFDVDWIVRVETGSMAEQDAAQDVQNFQNYVAFRVQYRIPTDFQKISNELALRMGVKNSDQYDLSPDQPGNAAPFDLPKVQVHFNDLPISGKIQVAKNMGVTLTPQDFANEPVLPDTTTQGLSPAEKTDQQNPGAGPTYGAHPGQPPAPIQQMPQGVPPPPAMAPMGH